MGKIRWPKHGGQGIKFASEQIVSRVRNGGNPDEPVFGVRLNWCDIEWICPVDAEFVKENFPGAPNLPIVATVDDGYRDDGLLRKLSPECRSCLSEYLRATAGAEELARLFDEN